MVGHAMVCAKSGMRSVLGVMGASFEVEDHPGRWRLMYESGHKTGGVGVAANFVLPAAEPTKAGNHQMGASWTVEGFRH
jgi:hypothetical protein